MGVGISRIATSVNPAASNNESSAPGAALHDHILVRQLFALDHQTHRASPLDEPRLTTRRAGVDSDVPVRGVVIPIGTLAGGRPSVAATDSTATCNPATKLLTFWLGEGFHVGRNVPAPQAYSCRGPEAVPAAGALPRHQEEGDFAPKAACLALTRRHTSHSIRSTH